MTMNKQKTLLALTAAAVSAALSGCRMAPKFYTSSDIIGRDQRQGAQNAEAETEGELPGADEAVENTEKGGERSESIDETESETETGPVSAIREDTLRTDLILARASFGQDFTWACSVPDEEKDFTFDALAGQYILTDYLYPDLPPLKGGKERSLAMLKSSLEAMLTSYDGTWSVYVCNLKTDESFVLNDTPQRSASLMKLFILGTVFQAMDNDTLTRSEEVTTLLSNMITVSSNTAANALLEKLGDGDLSAGIKKVNEYIEQEGYSSGTHEYNGFEDEETILDPDHFNQVTAADVGELLTRVYHRAFGSRSECGQAEDWMLNQQTRYKIPAGLPDGISVGNKTGETSDTENDAAVVYAPECDYILVVLSNSWDSKDTAQHEIQQISSQVYRSLCTDTSASWNHLFPALQSEGVD
jgi:beta-lactamase class A